MSPICNNLSLDRLDSLTVDEQIFGIAHATVVTIIVKTAAILEVMTPGVDRR